MMVRGLVTVAACSVLLLGGTSARMSGQGTTGAFTEYLRRMGVGPAQLDSAAKGHAIVKLLAASDEREVAVWGMIGVNGPRDTVRARSLDVERLLARSGAPFHVIANPATPADVRGVAFAESEYRDLRDCRPGQCGFKLPASEMKAFVEQVDWSSPGAKEQADERLRAGMLRLVAAYRAQGDAATPAYDDARGVHSGDVFATLVRQSPELYQFAPELERYLRAYPAGRPGSARDVLYWSEDRLPRLRPMITLNHAVTYVAAAGPAFVARMLIYASHYVEGAFELLAVVDAGSFPRGADAYLLVLRRFRLDNLPGGPLNVRGKVRQQLVEATRASLEQERMAIAR